MDNISLGKVLKDARKKSGMTQQQVANEAQISRTYYADIEGNRYSPSLVVFLKLAFIFNLDLNCLKQIYSNLNVGRAVLSNHDRDRNIKI